MAGTPVVNVNLSITKLVLVLMNKVKGQLVTANIKNVVKSVVDTTTSPAISRPDTSKTEAVRAVPARPDTSKTEAVRAVPVLNIKLNAILIAVIPELMSTAARRPAAGRAVKMTTELIIPNAPVQLCMNGAHRQKNASAQPDTNTLVPVPDILAAMAKAVPVNTKNVNAPLVILGMRRPELVSAAVLINTLVRAATSPEATAIAATTNIRNANVKPDSRGMPLAECASATAPTGVLLIKIARRWGISSKAVRASSSNAPLILIMPFAINSNAKRLLAYSPDGTAATLSSKRGNVKAGE